MSKHTPGYDVTDDGRVFSTESNWRGYGRRELVQDLNSHGYPSVRVVFHGKRKRLLVHVLVATKFIGEKPSEAHEVRHLDGDKTNNSVKNLVWGTRKENAADRELHGRTSRGDRHSKSIKSSSHKQNVKRGSEHYQSKNRSVEKITRAAIAKAKGEV